MRLLDLLEAHRDELFLEGGDMWPVNEWVTAWTAETQPGDRGPEVICREEPDGCLTVIALDAQGHEGEAVGVLPGGQ